MLWGIVCSMQTRLVSHFLFCFYNFIIQESDHSHFIVHITNIIKVLLLKVTGFRILHRDKILEKASMIEKKKTKKQRLISNVEGQWMVNWWPVGLMTTSGWNVWFLLCQMCTSPHCSVDFHFLLCKSYLQPSQSTHLSDCWNCMEHFSMTHLHSFLWFIWEI